VRILAAEQTVDNTNWFQGTADAVRRNLFHLELKGSEELLVLSGDHLYDMDYRELIKFHREKGADVTVSAIPIPRKEVSEFGILKISATGRIVSFKEKPKTDSEMKGYKASGGSYLASMGVYVFNCAALKKVLAGNDADFGKEVIPHSIKQLKGFSYIFDGYWRDVGTIDSFYDVNMGIAASKPQFSFFYDGSMFTRPRFLPAARIFSSSVERSIITEGSVIRGAQINDSIVGLRSIVGKGCRISRTVLMGADYYENQSPNAGLPIGIGDGTSIDKAIVDKNARIGRNVTIRNVKNLKNFDGKNYFIRDGIVIITKNAVVKPGTTI
jgi:glucose-1-phosphate adenylyltransferase